MNSNLLDILQYLNLSGAGAPQPMSAPPMMPMKPMAPIGNVSPLSQMPIPNNASVPPQALPNVSGSSQKNLGPLEAFLASPSTNTMPLPDMGGPINPFDKGSIAAIRAAKQSLGLTEEEKREAMGTAIMQFFANMSQPGGQPGFAGSLQKITQSLNPAMQAYDQYKAGITNQNMMLAGELANRQADYRKAQQQAMENALNRQDTVEYRKASLALQKLQNEQMTPYQRAHLALEREKLKNDYMMGGQIDEMPFSQMDKEEKKIAFDDINKARRNMPVYKTNIRNLQKMQEIFDKNPNIGTSYVQLLNDNSKDNFPTKLIKLWGKKLINKQDLDDMTELNKYAADLNLGVIKDYPAKTGTDVLKAMISKANPDGSIPKGAFDAITKDLIARNEHNKNYVMKALEGRKRGIFVMNLGYEEGENNNELSSEESGNSYENVPMISKEEAASGYGRVMSPEGVAGTAKVEDIPTLLKKGFKKI